MHEYAVSDAERDTVMQEKMHLGISCLTLSVFKGRSVAYEERLVGLGYQRTRLDNWVTAGAAEWGRREDMITNQSNSCYDEICY
jgi:hypothetical protein